MRERAWYFKYFNITILFCDVIVNGNLLFVCKSFQGITFGFYCQQNSNKYVIVSIMYDANGQSRNVNGQLQRGIACNCLIRKIIYAGRPY